MERKIIQICCSGVENTSSTQCSFIVVALCDDGTVWQNEDNTADRHWCKLEDIPQDLTK